MAAKLGELLRGTIWLRSSLDVYTWILFVGATAAQGTSHQDWFIERIVALPQPFTLGSTAKLCALQEQCFYLDHVQRPWLESLAIRVCLPGEDLNAN